MSHFFLPLKLRNMKSSLKLILIKNKLSKKINLEKIKSKLIEIIDKIEFNLNFGSLNDFLSAFRWNEKKTEKDK